MTIAEWLEEFIKKEKRTTLEIMVHEGIKNCSHMTSSDSPELIYKSIGRQSRVLQRELMNKPGFNVTGGVIYYEGN